MTPSPDNSTAPVAQLHALQRELILAQVRLMEMEDTRTALHTQLAAVQSLLSQIQAASDQALLRQDQLATELTAAQDKLRRHAEAETDLRNQLSATKEDLAEATASAHAATRRVAELDSERRRMKNSRSWRWTAPLRALERALQRHGKDRS